MLGIAPLSSAPLSTFPTFGTEYFTGVLSITGGSSLVVVGAARNAIAGPAVIAGGGSLVVAASSRDAKAGPVVVSCGGQLSVLGVSRNAIAGPIAIAGGGLITVAAASIATTCGPINVSGQGVVLVNDLVVFVEQHGPHWNLVVPVDELDGRASAAHMLPRYVRTAVRRR